MAAEATLLAARCLGEVLGTFLLVFFGCGAVHAAVLTGAQIGLWQVAIVWGIAVLVAVYAVGPVSGAHINPAVTVSLAVFRRCPASWVLPYIVSQLAGAMLAAALLFVLFSGFLNEREKELRLVRGEPGSELTAMCYGEYFPNPGTFQGPWRERLASFADKDGYAIQRELESFLAGKSELVTHGAAFLAEVIGTALLALVIFASTDPRNRVIAPGLAPLVIGLTIAILISVIAPLTQACFNPARDFGPRLVAYVAGWGQVALPGPNGVGCFTVYLLAPVLGAIAGGAVYHAALQPQAIRETPAENP